MESNLKLFTSYVTPINLKVVVEANYLPIFIIRNISKSNLIGKWSGTAIHYSQLSPSDKLFQDKRDGKIDLELFQKKYLIEISEINFSEIIRKFEYLTTLSGGKGIVLMSYGQDASVCHRTILADLLNNSGLLYNRVEEIL